MPPWVLAVVIRSHRDQRYRMAPFVLISQPPSFFPAIHFPCFLSIREAPCFLTQLSVS